MVSILHAENSKHGRNGVGDSGTCGKPSGLHFGVWRCGESRTSFGGTRSVSVSIHPAKDFDLVPGERILPRGNAARYGAIGRTSVKFRQNGLSREGGRCGVCDDEIFSTGIGLQAGVFKGGEVNTVLVLCSSGLNSQKPSWSIMPQRHDSPKIVVFPTRGLVD